MIVKPPHEYCHIVSSKSQRLRRLVFAQRTQRQVFTCMVKNPDTLLSGPDVYNMVAVHNLPVDGKVGTQVYSDMPDVYKYASWSSWYIIRVAV